MSNQISIIGAGLVGSLLGLCLRKKGFAVNLYEKRDDPRKARSSAGRSINLALSGRGIRPLKEAGVFEKIEPYLIPMHGRMMHDTQGNKTYQPYGKEGQFINSVSRAQLNEVLIETAENEGVHVSFSQKCKSVDFESTSIEFESGLQVKSDVLIGTDGAFSVIRKFLQQTDRFNFSQHYIEHGYKELIINPKDGDFALEPNFLHIWPRGNFMLIALPNADKTFTCTLFFPFEGDRSFAKLMTDLQIEDFFQSCFPNVVELIPDLVDQFRRNPTSSLITTKCFPWNRNHTILLGDAAHAIVPFYGQGMNSGFEDVRLFMEMSEKMGWNWKEILPSYSRARKKDADAISELALHNFIEMRDHVGDPTFLRRKKLETEIQQKFPQDWTPLYSMVTFSHMPYSEALRLGKLQQQVLENYTDHQSPNIEEIVGRFNALKTTG